MRKKINNADKLYIEINCLKMDKEEISKEIELNVNAFDEYFDFCFEAKKTEAKKTEAKEESKGYAVMTQGEAELADDATKKHTSTGGKQSHIWRGNVTG